MASYSASLYVVAKANLIAHSKRFPSRLTITTSAPLLFWVDDQSVYATQLSSTGSPTSSGNLLNSARKSANACILIVVHGWKSTSNSSSSTTQLTNLLKISNFCRTIFNGCSLRTLMACAWKYDLNLLAKTLSMQIPLSLFEDIVPLPREELYW
jgi:hypothetical protein